MKATIEECHQQVAATDAQQTGSTILAGKAVALGLVAIAYAIRDVAFALLRERPRS